MKITNETPEEVLEALVFLNWKAPMGIITATRIEETIQKYPKYFKEILTYRSIDKNVHEEYKLKLSELHDKYFPFKNNIPEGVSYYQYIKSRENAFKENNENIFNIAGELFKLMKIRDEYKIEKEKLWNKYYKKYNLKYNEQD